MDEASALPEYHVSACLFHDVATQITVWSKNNGLILRNLVNNFDGVGTGTNNVADRFNASGAVDVGND